MQSFQLVRVFQRLQRGDNLIVWIAKMLTTDDHQGLFQSRHFPLAAALFDAFGDDGLIGHGLFHPGNSFQQLIHQRLCVAQPHQHTSRGPQSRAGFSRRLCNRSFIRAITLGSSAALEALIGANGNVPGSLSSKDATGNCHTRMAW